MEPVSLTVGAIAAALIAKLIDRTADATVTKGETVLRRLLESVRAHFLAGGDSEALDTLELVERAPDSQRQLSELARAIDRHATDEAFRGELENLIEQAKASGVTVKQTSQVAHGDGNVQIADISGGSEVKVKR
jgi:hypothetical protein